MRRRALRVSGVLLVALVLLLVFGGSAAQLYTDALWFAELGLSSVFRERVLAVVAVRLTVGVLVAVLVFANLAVVARRLGPVHVRRRYGNLEIAEQVPRRVVLGLAFALAALAGWWLSGIQFGGSTPLEVWAWFRHVTWGVQDPLFGRDLSFYVFVLPLAFRLLDLLLLAILWAAFLVAAGYGLVGGIRVVQGRPQLDQAPRLHLALLAAAALVLVAARLWFDRYALLLGGSGFRGAVGYTDIHARLPALLVTSALALSSAVAVIYGARRRLWAPPALALGLFVVASVLGRGVYPAIVQKVQVEPNQLVREEPYIRWNLEFTRRGYGVDGIARDTLPYRLATARDWSANETLLGTLPLWDPEPLQRVFTELQAPQAYYTFLDVDYDRYATGGEARQIAIGVREFRSEGLEPGTRTWHNIHLVPRFTRGYGAVVVPSDESVQGQPVFWLSGVSPIQRAPSAPAEIRLTDPAVYFGEGSSNYLVLTPDSTSAPGVPLGSFLRVLAFAWRFGDQNLLFARGLTDSSRVLFRRQVLERLRAVSPFLEWDPDPLPFLRDGRIVWLVDGYTVSSSFPISRPMVSQGLGVVRYVRASVKALVDASNGSVTIYAVASEPDPILASYGRVFPGLIRPASEIPEDVRAHFRYPALALRLQADVLQEYHLRDPEAFFVGQDAWEVPQDLTGSPTGMQFRPVYLSARLPGTTSPEFIALLPFIARQRQNLTGLLAARNDPPRYGELVLLQLSRERQIRGPGQVQSLIEQDPGISAQLSLWRQRGTNVDLGRLRIVPADSTLLYVRPLFLTAQDQEGAIPQLQRVIVSDGAEVSMAETLEEAIAGLYASAPVVEAPAPAANAPPPAANAQPPAGWPSEALELYDQAQELLRRGDFAGFGEAWARLREVLVRASQGGSRQ